VFVYSTFFPGLRQQPFQRQWLHKFLALCFASFDVGIWTSVTYERTKEIMDFTFTQEERRQFKFVKCGTDVVTAYKRRIRHSSKEAPVILKLLEDIWSHFSGYDDSNTLLIDTQPYHAFGNPTCTSLFISAFKFPQNDEFLTSYLWPCLVQLTYACHTRIFIQECEPRWSRDNAKIQKDKYKDIYKELKKNHSCFFYGEEMAKPQFSVLKWSEFELSWDVREYILSIFSKMGPSVEEMSNKQIVDAAFDLGLTMTEHLLGIPRDF